jgi:hypothetical protein
LLLPLTLGLSLLQPLHKIFDVWTITQHTRLLLLLLLLLPPLLLVLIQVVLVLVLVLVLLLGHLPRLLVQAATAAGFLRALAAAATHKPTIRPACCALMHRPCTSSSWCNGPSPLCRNSTGTAAASAAVWSHCRACTAIAAAPRAVTYLADSASAASSSTTTTTTCWSPAAGSACACATGLLHYATIAAALMRYSWCSTGGCN